MNLVSLGRPLFDLELTLNSGQAFHWVREGAGWLGTIEAQATYLEQRDGVLWVNAGGAAAAERYLALDHPLEEIYATFPRDPVSRAALEFCSGMRILRQPQWEAVATFITSSMKQVAHIAQISHTLRRRFGREEKIEGKVVYSYPGAEALAVLEEADLRACALGYRAKNLLSAARLVAGGSVNLCEVARLEDAEAQRELMRLPGVGEKVANCALLFGFERLRAFPVDVWIERVIREKYFGGAQDTTAASIRAFCATAFGPYGGYMQQYLFHHARLTWKKS
ncbi:MAG: DNA glycosylase [Verrucomicrobiota bacterium]